VSTPKRLDTELVIGGAPRADLLPQEIKNEVRAKAQRRRLFLGAALAVGLVGAVFAFSVFMVVSSAVVLASANERTAVLLTEQTKYAEVRTVETQVATAEAARRIGTSTEIDWEQYLQSVQSTLPDGATTQTLTVASATPLTVFTVPANPLEGSRMAEIVFAVTTPALPDVAVWMDNLAETPGFVDAYPSAIVMNDAGNYSVGMTMHINEGALANRFPAKDEAAK
jgi:Tfp pilus assembly protein PilN